MSNNKLLQATATVAAIAVFICCIVSPTNFYHEPLRIPNKVEAKEPEYALVLIGSTTEPVFVDYRQAKCNVAAYILANGTATHLAQEEFEAKFESNEVDDVLNKVMANAYPNITEELIDLFARAIWNETGVLGTESMYFTGSVMLNRVKHWAYKPTTLEGVIYQSGQYAITWTGLIHRPAPQEAYDIARDLLYNGSVLPEDVVFQAQFKQGSKVYKQIGNTFYCYY